MKKIIFLILIIFLGSMTIFFIKNNLVSEIYPKNNKEIKTNNQSISKVKINNKIIKVEIADEPDERTRGLSYRDSLCDDCGMLFIFPEKKVKSFWMKDMNFPIDIIWIDDDQIVKIDKNLKPEGIMPKETYSSEVPVNYVLELNTNFSINYNIKIGDKIKIE